MQPFRTPTTRKKQLDKRVGIRLKVADDGTPGGLSITDAETGAQLWGVESVIIQLRRGEAPSAIIRVTNIQVDATATVEVVQEGLTEPADVFPGKQSVRVGQTLDNGL